MTLEKFLNHYHVRKFAKGELILVQGEVPSCAYIIKSGVVKTYNLTADGDEKPISFEVKNDVMPLGWVFHQLKHATYFYEAFNDVEVYCLSRDEYLDFLHTNPGILYDTYTHLVGIYVNHQMRINALEQSRASAKVLNTIHFLCLRFGQDVKSDVVRIKLPITQQELANFMGLTRETTVIELKKLQRQGVLTYQRQNYVVKTDKLNELLDDDYDVGLLR